VRRAGCERAQANSRSVGRHFRNFALVHHNDLARRRRNPHRGEVHWPGSSVDVDDATLSARTCCRAVRHVSVSAVQGHARGPGLRPVWNLRGTIHSPRLRPLRTRGQGSVAVKRRIARDLRRAGVRVVLGPRDEALLRGLARFRVARTDDLVRLFFRGIRRDTAAARLRKLHDAGFIEARSDGLNEPNFYQLGPEGLCWAEDRGVAVGAPPAAPATHHQAIVGCWSRLAAALAADESLRLRRFEPDWELRARLAGTGSPVVPDAAIEIVSRGPASLPDARIALEVDLTTERPGALRRKLQAYEVSRCFDGSSPVTLVVVLFGARERRIASVRSLVESEWRGLGQVFTESSWPETLLREVCGRPLAGPPSGKGRAERVTCDAGTPSTQQGEEFSP